VSGKANRPPDGKPWIWLTKEVIASDAWRSLSINAYRFLNFLMLELMKSGGTRNGELKAPDLQLRAFGIGAQYVGGAIRETEELGLVECHRGGMRVATKYALTWYPHQDGTPASDLWRKYRNPTLKPLAAAKARNLPTEGKAGLPNEKKADGANLPTEGKADCPENLPTEGKVLLRRFLPGQPASEEIGDCTSDRPASSPAGTVMSLRRRRWRRHG